MRGRTFDRASLPSAPGATGGTQQGQTFATSGSRSQADPATRALIAQARYRSKQQLRGEADRGNNRSAQSSQELQALRGQERAKSRFAGEAAIARPLFRDNRPDDRPLPPAS